METSQLLLSLLLPAILGLAATYTIVLRNNRTSGERAEIASNEILGKTKKEALELNENTKKNIEQIKRKNEEDLKNAKSLHAKIEQSIKAKEEVLKKKEQKNHEEQGKINALQEDLQKIQEKRQGLQKESTVILAEKAGTTVAQAREDLIQKIQYECTEENETAIKSIEEHYREHAEKIAKEILAGVMQRMSAPTSVEPKTEQVNVPFDSVKPQLVGEGGKNIKLFEELLGVDVIFNDFPNTITLSCFNLVSRKIAKNALERLVRERGKITEETITKTIELAKLDTDKELFAIGKDAVKKVKIQRDLDPELIKIIGRLQFRTSYGQNIMRHSYEVGYVAQMLAAEIGANQDIARIGGFLHDLGKAIDQNPDIIGAHDYLTKELMEKYNFSWEETHAAWVHHDAEPQQTAEALLVKAADAVSAARPGARQESIDRYIERIRALEDIATSYPSVDKAFAISAGREVRVLVNANEINDTGVKELAPLIAAQIEKEVAYPGQVRVNVIRRTRHTQTARGSLAASRN